MRPILVVLSVFVFLAVNVTSAFSATSADQKAPEKRLAFVVGNESYAAGALPTAANDAGLVAQTLQAAGFSVIGARDLDAETLRQSYAEFLKRVTAAGPNAVAFVYLSGYGLQYGTDNYYVPIGAAVSRDLDIPVEAVRLADLTGPLDALNLKARFTVFDIAYRLPFQTVGAPLPGGLAAVDATPGSLVAYNAAPGTVAAPAKGNYGAFAQTLAATLREPGLVADAVFERVRLRVDAISRGAEVPWGVSKIDTTFHFFERGPAAPPAETDQIAALRARPLKALPATQAYRVAVARDTVAAYGEFETAFPDDTQARRVRVLLAVRREAATWRRSVAVDTPAAYWSYLGRYPKGRHAGAARGRLTTLSAALTPPPDFQAITYDVPPPPPDEAAYADVPLVDLGDPAYGPPPVDLLPPIPAAFLELAAPPPPDGLFLLPVPGFVPLPDWCDPPPFVALPLDDPFYGGTGAGTVFINGAGVVNRTHRGFGDRHGLARAVPLPGAAQQRAGLRARQGGGVAPGASGKQRLPGANGRPLPATDKAAGSRDHRAKARAARTARPGKATHRSSTKAAHGRAAKAARADRGGTRHAARAARDHRGTHDRRGARVARGSHAHGAAHRSAETGSRGQARRAQASRHGEVARGVRRGTPRPAADARTARPRSAVAPRQRAGAPAGATSSFGRGRGFGGSRPGFAAPRPGGLGGSPGRRPGDFGRGFAGAPRPAFPGARGGGFAGGRPGGFGGGGFHGGGFGGGGFRGGGFGGGGFRGGFGR